MEHSTTTKHAILSQWIKARILDGTYPSGTKIPSEHELAEQFAISRQTVRHSISQLESEGFLMREQGSGTYVKQFLPGTSSKKSMRIGVITTYLDDYIFPGIIHQMEEILSENGYTLTLGITHNKPSHEEKCLNQMLQTGVDGLLIEGTKSALPSMNADLFRTIKQQGIPMVFLNGYYSGISDSYVVMDDCAAGELLCDCLIEHGHTKIGGIFKSDDLQGIRRYEGVITSLRKHGLSLQESSYFWYTTEDLPAMFDGCMDQILLRRFADCSALVCYNDQIAASLIKLLNRHQLEVPKDYSLASFDNSPLAKQVACNLTSIVYPTKEIGTQAAKLLLDQIHHHPYPKSILLAPKLIQRSSIQTLL